MPRFAANLNWLFTEHGFLERFAAAREAGFRAVEFPSPYAHPPAQVGERLRDNGLECVLFNLPMGERERGDFGIACRPGREAEFREGVARALEYARVLGAPRLNCIAGTQQPGDDPALLRRTLVGNLRHAARALADAGIELVIEPINSRDVPGFLVPRSTLAAEIVAEVDDANLGLQCDLYHTAMMGDDCAAILDGFRPLIRHIQFADVPGRGEPGSGELDLQGLFARIDASGYAGWVSAEYRPSSTTPQSLAWMSESA